MLIICASAYFALALASGDIERHPDRFVLACSGTIASPPGSPATGMILADGRVDMIGGRVQGFGMGGQAITSVSSTHIAFGSGIGGAGDHLIEGSIDRQTFETHIQVNGTDARQAPVMALSLDCHLALPTV